MSWLSLILIVFLSTVQYVHRKDVSPDAIRVHVTSISGCANYQTENVGQGIEKNITMTN